MITKEEKCVSSAINSLMKCADWVEDRAENVYNEENFAGG